MHILIFLFVMSGQQPPPANTPEAAVQAFKTALEAGDVKTLGGRTAGEHGVTLRKLAEPLGKLKTANDRFDKSLQAKNISFDNIFTAGLTPFADLKCDPVEITTKDGKTLARLKMTKRGKVQEEVAAMKQEEGNWRIGLPQLIAKTLPAKTRVDDHVKAFEKLAEILTTAAADVEAGKLKTKEAVTLRLVAALEEGKVTELLR